MNMNKLSKITTLAMFLSGSQAKPAKEYTAKELDLIGALDVDAIESVDWVSYPYIGWF